MFRNVWKSISCGSPGRPKRHKYHNSWNQNTILFLLFRGPNDAWGISCLHQFARSYFDNNEKPGGGFAYRTIAFSMISQNQMLRNEWTSTSSGTLNMVTVVFRILHVPKVTPKTINIPLCLHYFLEIKEKNDPSARPQTKDFFEMYWSYQGDHWEPSRTICSHLMS